MNLTNKSVEAILSSEEVFDYALKLILHYGHGPAVLTVKPLTALSEALVASVCEVAEEALLDCNLEVEGYEAEQDKGVYDINIMGVPGAYYIQAPEYEDMGFFETLEEARQALRSRYGEFLRS